jgi:hypothetical protein
MTAGPNRLQAHLSVTVDQSGHLLRPNPSHWALGLSFPQKTLLSSTLIFITPTGHPHLCASVSWLALLGILLSLGSSVQQCGGFSNKGASCFRFLPVREKTR